MAAYESECEPEGLYGALKMVPGGPYGAEERIMLHDTITINGDTVEARSPEGVTATLKVDEFIGKVNPPLMNCCGLILPDGAATFFSTRSTTIFFWQIPPAVHHVRWISPKSEVCHKTPGKTVLYDDRRIALPYVLIVAVFVRDSSGRLVLSGKNEAYFRTAPLEDYGDELLYPALLNISKFPRQSAAAMPLSWICTQYLSLRKLAAEPDFNTRVRKSLKALRSTMLEAGFNYSSEHHELASHWSVAAKKIPEVADLDRWEQLSREDPLFALKVPWLPATWGGRKLTVKRLVARIEKLLGKETPALDSSDALARFVFERSPNGKRS